ncbi:MAG TPA: DUF72 domain-containing protein [Bryobacteraceae bacterium]|nr:DUF72 domain-containing protein [Bryobacteraceae bacterium]
MPATNSCCFVKRRFHIGTAGWAVPIKSAERCPGVGTHLQRYARVLRCAEINTTFHRPHEEATYQRWARSTGPSFRFAAKVPRLITHELRLQGTAAVLDRFLGETRALGPKRGPLLVQLPPSLEFDARIAGRFFELLRRRSSDFVVCEPRHASWFSTDAEALLQQFEAARVAADPTTIVGADRPGGWQGIVYYRLHGSPRKYWSAYEQAFLEEIADAIRRTPASTAVWCIFDNTAGGAALENAWHLSTLLNGNPDKGAERGPQCSESQTG